MGTTEACLACYTQPEDLADDHRILCDACHKNQPVTKQVALELLPPILIVHFKRFQHTGHVSRKLTTPVTLAGSELNLAPFLSDEAAARSDPTVYRLVGVVNHV